jgi:glutaredoxin
VVKEFLSQEGVEFTLKNVVTDSEAQEEFLRAGYRLPPVTVIDGVAVEGFLPDRIQALLNGSIEV